MCSIKHGRCGQWSRWGHATEDWFFPVEGEPLFRGLGLMNIWDDFGSSGPWEYLAPLAEVDCFGRVEKQASVPPRELLLGNNFPSDCGIWVAN